MGGWNGEVGREGPGTFWQGWPNHVAAEPSWLQVSNQGRNRWAGVRRYGEVWRRFGEGTAGRGTASRGSLGGLWSELGRGGGWVGGWVEKG